MHVLVVVPDGDGDTGPIGRDARQRVRSWRRPDRGLVPVAVDPYQSSLRTNGRQIRQCAGIGDGELGRRDFRIDANARDQRHGRAAGLQAVGIEADGRQSPTGNEHQVAGGQIAGSQTSAQRRGDPRREIEQHDLSAGGACADLRVDDGLSAGQCLGIGDSATRAGLGERLDRAAANTHPHEAGRSGADEEGVVRAPLNAMDGGGPWRQIRNRLRRSSLHGLALERQADTEADPLAVGREEGFAAALFPDRQGQQLTERSHEDLRFACLVGPVCERLSVRRQRHHRSRCRIARLERPALRQRLDERLRHRRCCVSTRDRGRGQPAESETGGKGSHGQHQHRPASGAWPGRRERGLFLQMLELEPRVADIAQSPPRILLEAAPQQPPESTRRAGRKRRPVRLALEHGGDGVRDRRARERLASRQHLVEDAAEGPDVGALVDRRAPRLFGAHECGRAEHDAVDSSRACASSPEALASPASERTLAIPKSRTLTSPSRVILMFAGFRSRWTMPRSWA